MSADAATYDELYAQYPPYHTTPMKAMYDAVARMIPRTAPVVDLGCGSGYLASALKARPNYIGQYTGLDLSRVGVEMAEAALADTQLSFLPTEQYQFFVQDLGYWEPTIDGHTHRTVFTSFEVLEHYIPDVALVNKLPARSRFIFSVPNYWSQTHVRTYDSVGASYNRYAHALSYKSWQIFRTSQPEAAIYLFDSIRRADKW